MHAVILIGHGSIRSASGAAMIRIAARLREQGVAPLVEAAFLNYSRPTLAEMVAKCVEHGATDLLIQPYFLLSGAYVEHDLPGLVDDERLRHPQLTFRIGLPFLDHPGMVQLACKRIDDARRQTKAAPAAQGLLLMAHGTPIASANAPLYPLLDALRAAEEFGYATVGFMECNSPNIPDAAAHLVDLGASTIVALPYFLHLGRHVRDDLPRMIGAAQAQRPQVEIILAHHLDYDLLLTGVIRDRIHEARVGAKIGSRDAGR